MSRLPVAGYLLSLKKIYYKTPVNNSSNSNVPNKYSKISASLTLCILYPYKYKIGLTDQSVLLQLPLHYYVLRPLATTADRRKASSMCQVLTLDLVGKVGLRHVPCLRTSWVGSFGDTKPHVYPCPQTSTLCSLFNFRFSKAACPCLEMWSTDSLSESFFYLVSIHMSKSINHYWQVHKVK